MSKKVIGLSFVLATLPLSAFSEGMDCSKAKIETEKLICSHSALYDLDRQMTEAFRSTKKIVENYQDKRDLTVDDFMTNHKEWLTAVRKLPTDMKDESEGKKTDAITQKYKERIASLKIMTLLNLPYTDERAEEIAPLMKNLEQGSQMLLYTLTSGDGDQTAKISCDMFKNYPDEAVYGFDAQFGSSMDNFIPLCDNTLSKDIPELEKLLSLVKDMSMSYKGQPCTGTIAYGYIRSSMVDDVLARYAPAYRISDNAKKAIPVSSVKKDKLTPDMVLKAFNDWKNGGAWEQMHYTKMTPLVMPAIEAVQKYYQKNKLVAEKDIPLYSAYTVAHLVNSYASETLDPAGGSDEDKDTSTAQKDPNETAVMRAVAEQNSKMLSATLNKKGVDVNQQNGFGETALILAVQTGNPELVKILIEAKADINKGTLSLKEDDYDKQIEACNRPYGYMGLSPLMIAVRYGSNVEVIKLLVQAGANIKTKSRDDKTALDYVDDSSFNDTDKQIIKGLLK